MTRLTALVLALGLLCAWHLTAGEKPEERELATDPAKAGPDYLVQGEYDGQINSLAGKKQLGAQVIAMGGGTFHVVYLPGGLPGAGWDGKTRLETKKPDGNIWNVDGKIEGGGAVFTTPYAATISVNKDGERILAGKTDKGEAFELKRTIRLGPTQGMAPPAGATVLFDGTSLEHWVGKGQIDERKFLVTAAGDAVSKDKFQNFVLHVEYMVPFKPYARGQERGNSGVYLQNRYEIQVLDSFGLKGLNNESGGIYTKAAPKVNMAYPPLTWQTYDIDFQAAQFADGKKVKNAVVSLKYNGVAVHENVEINDKTGGGDAEGPTPGSIKLQGHGNPVYFRNVWVVEKK
jgi:hypothetical protein